MKYFIPLFICLLIFGLLFLIMFICEHDPEDR